MGQPVASARSDARAAEPEPGCGSSAPDRVTTGATVADVMVRRPRTWPAELTVAQARQVLQDDHVHAVLVVEDTRLLAVVDRSDLGDAEPVDVAGRLGRLEGRTVAPDAELEPVRLALVRSGRRRLAVVDTEQRLLGLLCLKRTGLGFCTDDDVEARAADRAASVPPVGLEPTLRPF
ncbi:HPP family protein [uncultured Jatrophihabitans sp.]|uniref:CBS domain-containing protein n=1 Tax=uncultured Jatrophihabitans sp. TaxID=1610747 RepID=UPI0035CC903D